MSYVSMSYGSIWVYKMWLDGKFVNPFRGDGKYRNLPFTGAQWNESV